MAKDRGFEPKNETQGLRMRNAELIERYFSEGITEEEKGQIEEEIIKNNEGLVYDVAKNFSYKKFSNFMDDIVSEGRLGLLQAIRTFKPDRGAVFSTYAVICIRNYISNNLSKITDAPIGFQQKELDFRKTFFSKHKRPPTDKEIAEHFNISISQYYNITLGAISLDKKVKKDRDASDDESPLGLFIPDTTQNPEERALSEATVRAILEKLNFLSPSVKKVFIERCANKKSYEQIAAECNITPDSARQFVLNARRELRRRFGNSDGMMRKISNDVDPIKCGVDSPIDATNNTRQK